MHMHLHLHCNHKSATPFWVAAGYVQELQKHMISHHRTYIVDPLVAGRLSISVLRPKGLVHETSTCIGLHVCWYDEHSFTINLVI